MNILGIPFEIKLVEMDEETHGECVPTERVINLNKAYLESMEETLRHEVFHAMLAITGLTHLMSAEVEEAVVTLFENAINKQLLDEISGMEERLRRSLEQNV